MVTGKPSWVELRKKGSERYRKKLCRVENQGRKPPATLEDRCQGRPRLVTCGASGDMAGHQVSPSRPDCSSRSQGGNWLTRKEALYGSPIGKLAKTAKSRFAVGDLKARLWDIS